MSETVNVEVPTVGESITEVQLGAWVKSQGDWVDAGEDLVEIETEKASVQLPSPAAGFLEGIVKQEEDFAEIGVFEISSWLSHCSGASRSEARCIVEFAFTR